MPIELDQSLPKYLQISQAIERMIAERTLVPGNRLPNEKELAVRFGASPVTVSRGLQELVQRGILDRRVGSGTYVRDQATPEKTSRARATPTVGLIGRYDLHTEWYGSTILHHVTQAMAEKSIHPSIFATSDSDYLRLAKEHDLAGLILISPCRSALPQIKRAVAAGCPLVVLGSQCPSLEDHCFTLDDVGESRRLVRHLIDRGHRNIGIVAGQHESYALQARLQGYREELWAAGLPHHPQWVIASENLHYDSQAEAPQIAAALTLQERPTALVSASFHFALTTLKVAAAEGLRIPEDLSIVSFDDPPSAEHLSVPLTTIRQPLAEMVRDACDAIQALIQGLPLGQGKTYAGTLIERSSCAAPPKTR